jgi:hypothetical protein
MAVDQSGYPYLVWTDNRATNDGIYYAPSTYMQSTPLLSGLIDASSGGTVGISDVQNITSVDDVSIVVPAGAAPYDVTISIARRGNAHDYALPLLNEYEFSPSGVKFNSPVTITIPYAVSNTAGTPTAYWYDAATGMVSQQDIQNSQIIQLTSSLHALSFTTTHLTPYCALLGAATDPGDGGGDSDTGGDSGNGNSQKGKGNNNAGGRKK